MTKGVPKPIPFSGHPDEDINAWLEHFHAISSLNKWSQDDCANLLHIFLKGPALRYFQGLDVEVRHNFHAAISALTLFDMGGGHDGPPKMFLTTVPKRFGRGS